MGKFHDLINGDQPVLVDFFAEWCGPCKVMAPILEEIAGKVKDKAKILKVDIDKNPAAAMQYQVQAVPTLILFKKGAAVWRQPGVVDAQSLMDVIAKFS